MADFLDDKAQVSGGESEGDVESSSEESGMSDFIVDTDDDEGSEINYRKLDNGKFIDLLVRQQR